MLTKSVKSTLWSYNLQKINLEKDKQLIIQQVLNWGDKKATDWLFKNYNFITIKNAAQNIPIGNWNKKSLNYWSIILDIKPKKRIIK